LILVVSKVIVFHNSVHVDHVDAKQ
jgi:hypothetical protein